MNIKKLLLVALISLGVAGKAHPIVVKPAYIEQRPTPTHVDEPLFSPIYIPLP